MGDSPNPTQPTPQPPARPMLNPSQWIFFFALGLGAFICLTSIGIMAYVTFGPKSPAQPAATEDYLRLDGTHLGSPDAKVEVVAIVPLDMGCHRGTLSYLQKACSVSPEQIQVHFFNMHAKSGQAELAKRGVSCASLFINGANRFTHPDGGQVKFAGPVEDDNYTAEDVRLILQAELTKAYGSNAPALPASGTKPGSRTEEHQHDPEIEGG